MNDWKTRRQQREEYNRLLNSCAEDVAWVGWGTKEIMFFAPKRYRDSFDSLPLKAPVPVLYTTRNMYFPDIVKEELNVKAVIGKVSASNSLTEDMKETREFCSEAHKIREEIWL